MANTYPGDHTDLAAGSEAWADTVTVYDTSAFDGQSSGAGLKEMTLKEFQLQAYGGVMDAASTAALTGSASQITFDANYGPTAYNCTVAADKDDITADLGGIYEFHFETSVQYPQAATLTFSVRDDGTDITGALSAVEFVAGTVDAPAQVCISGIADVAAGSVLDVAALASANNTATMVHSRFWIRRIGARA